MTDISKDLTRMNIKKLPYDAKNIETAFKWPNFVEGFIFKPLSLSKFKSNRFKTRTKQFES